MTEKTLVRLHPDWPSFTLPTDDWLWDLPTPVDDLARALEDAEAWTAQPGPFSESVGTLTLADIAEVEAYYVSYHGDLWTPENPRGGTELDMVVLMRLHDGPYASVQAWNDYTGWGCQDGAFVRVGSREDVIANGLDNEGREHLGLSL